MVVDEALVRPLVGKPARRSDGTPSSVLRKKSKVPQQNNPQQPPANPSL